MANQDLTNTSVPTDKIEFLNGDVLQGTLKSIKNQSNIEFVPVLINNAISVNTEGVGKIYFGAPSNIGKRTSGNSIVRLANKDIFLGNFVSLDTNKLVIDTSFAGRLNIERRLLKTLTPSDGAGMIYDGPNSLSEWTVHNPGYFMNVVVQGAKPGAPTTIQQIPWTWVFTNNALYNFGNGAIGRFFDLPDKSSIDFELSWRGNLSFTVFFYTDSLSPYAGKSYMILFTYRAAYLHRRASQSGISVLGQVEIPDFSKDSVANISIKIDKEQRLIALFVNDKLVQTWKDESEFVGAGNGVVFNQQSSSKVKLSKIRITRWDGIIEHEESVTNKANIDIVRLTNKDSVEGKIISITNNIISVQTDYGNLDIPFERTSEIVFAAHRADNFTNQLQRTVRGYLRDYGAISFLIEKWTDDKIIASSPGIGEIELSPTAFRILQYNENKQNKQQEIENPFEGFNDSSE